MGLHLLQTATLHFSNDSERVDTRGSLSLVQVFSDFNLFNSSIHPFSLHMSGASCIYENLVSFLLFCFQCESKKRRISAKQPSLTYCFKDSF